MDEHGPVDLITDLQRQLAEARALADEGIENCRILCAALRPFAYPTEVDGTFLVTGHEVNRAREALARVTGGT